MRHRRNGHRRPIPRRVKIIALLVLIVAGAFWWGWRQYFRAHSKWVPASGGIFTESTVGSLQNLNPLAPRHTLLDRDLHQLLYEGLLRHNPLTGLVEENLATFRMADDAKTYFITLKDSARFSNGDPVTIDDVIFTYEQVIQNPNFSNEILRGAFEYISIDVVDEKTLAFYLPEPNVFFPSLLTQPILHRASFRNALIEEITDSSFPGNKKPVGAGPFVLQNIIPEDSGRFRIFLERNPYYFRGKPFLKQLVLYVYPNFDHLKIEHTWTTMYSKLPERELERFQASLFDEYAAREYVLPRFVGVFFNLDSPAVQNPGLREALEMAVDKDRILKNEIGWNRIDSIFFFENVESWHERNFPAARLTLRDNGFRYNEERDIRLFDGKPVQLKMITSTQPPVYSRFAQNMRQTWEQELEISVQLEVLNPIEFQQALAERNYDLVLFGQNFSENFDSLSTWHSSQSGKLNLANLTQEEIDALIDDVRLSGAQSDLFELNKKLTELVPAFILATPQYHLLVDRDLLGFSGTFGKIRTHAERFYNVHEWHFYQKRDWDWDRDASKFFGFFHWLFSQI